MRLGPRHCGHCSCAAVEKLAAKVTTHNTVAKTNRHNKSFWVREMRNMARSFVLHSLIWPLGRGGFSCQEPSGDFKIICLRSIPGYYGELFSGAKAGNIQFMSDSSVEFDVSAQLEESYVDLTADKGTIESRFGPY